VKNGWLLTVDNLGRRHGSESIPLGMGIFIGIWLNLKLPGIYCEKCNEIFETCACRCPLVAEVLKNIYVRLKWNTM